jgi:hypothetical protein
MSEALAIAIMLSRDAEILAQVGAEERIRLGSLSEKPAYAPPLILVEAQEKIPAIEGEDGVIAERCVCTIGLLVEHDLETLAARIRSLMEESDYRLEALQRISGQRREWRCAELSFSATRLLP